MRRSVLYVDWVDLAYPTIQVSADEWSSGNAEQRVKHLAVVPLDMGEAIIEYRDRSSACPAV